MFTQVPGADLDFLTLMSIVFGNYSLSVGSLLLAVFVGYRWGVAGASQEIEREGIRFRLRPMWAFLLRFLCPVAVAVIIVYIVWTGNYF